MPKSDLDTRNDARQTEHEIQTRDHDSRGDAAISQEASWQDFTAPPNHPTSRWIPEVYPRHSVVAGGLHVSGRKRGNNLRRLSAQEEKEIERWRCSRV